MIPIIVVVLFVLLFVFGYVSAKPNEAIVITGLGKPRTLIGRSGFMIPFIEKRSYISIEQFSTDVQTTDFVPTLDFINVKADAVVKVKVGVSDELLNAAAQNFLNWKTADISASIQDVLEGNLREIIGQMELRDMVNNRQALQKKSNPTQLLTWLKWGWKSLPLRFNPSQMTTMSLKTWVLTIL